MKKLTDLSAWKKGCGFFDIRYPFLCGAMTWISDARLVTAVDEAGGVGFLAAGNMPVDLLRKEIRRLREQKVKYGVNLITIAPLFREHLQLVTEMKVPFVVFAGSFPRRDEIQMVKNAGARVLCFASTRSIAQRMIRYGADGLILEGNEAGGHIGHVSTLVLVQQVLFEFPRIPIFVAGGIATGRIIAHLFLMGAAGVQMGTIFAMSDESPAHPRFKTRYLRANSREAFSTPEYDSSLPVVSVRALKNQGTRAFGKLQLDLLKQLGERKISRMDAQYKVEEYWMDALRRAVVDGDIETGSLMAGQSVGLIDQIKPVRSIIQDLFWEASSHFDRLVSGLC
jgi:enoyl-[acyl-carrier protein] reductase II